MTNVLRVWDIEACDITALQKYLIADPNYSSAIFVLAFALFNKIDLYRNVSAVIRALGIVGNGFPYALLPKKYRTGIPYSTKIPWVIVR